MPPTRALRVFLLAQREVRAAQLARVRKKGAEEAKRILEAEDADRIAYLRHHFERDPDNAVFYDLSINTGNFSPEQSVDLIIDALVRRFPGCAAAASRSASTNTGSAARIE